MHNKYLSFAIRLILGSVFIYASISKIEHPAQFLTVIENYRLLSTAQSHYAALFLPWLELFCGLFLMTGIFVETSAGLISIMLVFFMAALLSALLRGLDIDCGCFSSGADGASVSALRLLEDMAMLAMAVYLYYFYEPWLGLNNWLQKMKIFRIPFFLLIFSASALHAQTTLTILHTNNINGTLENCLCADHPLGSIEKIKTQVDSIRSKNPNVLFVDTGDFFSAFGDKQKDRFSAQAQRLLSHDVLGLGDQEFSNGAAFFRNEIYRKELPYISLNLKIDGIPNLPSFKNIRAGDLNILITSVISPDVFRFYDKAAISDIHIADPVSALQAFLSGHSADYVILLSHLGLEQDKMIAQKFSALNLIIGGHSQDVLEKPVRINKTEIVQAGSDGYYLGKTEVRFSKKKKVIGFTSALLPMYIRLANDEQIAALARRYDFGFIKKSFKHHKLPEPIAESFLVRSAQSCAACHQKQYEKWRKSAHASSWKSIRGKKKTKSAQCVVCHVSGFGRPDGFINENLTPGLKAVTCTDCHRIYPLHLQKKNKETVERIDASVCRRCHDTQNDPTFNFKKDKMQITH